MNDAKFSKGTKNARSSLRSLAEGAVALNSALGVVSAVANAAERGIGAFMAQSEGIDNLGKLSDRLGFTTEDLISLQHGAKLAGVETDTLNGALQKMVINLAKGSKGG